MLLFFYYAAAILSSVFTGLFYKLGSLRGGKNRSAPALLCAVYMAFASIYYLAAILLSGKSMTFSTSTFWCAMLCGVCLSLAAYLYLCSLACGPYTASVVLLNFSSITTIFYSIVFLKETMTLVQGIGFVLMLVCIYTITVSKTSTASSAPKKASLKWIILIILTFITNSFINFGIRMQVVFNDGAEKNEMMCLYFAIGAVTSLVVFIVTGGFSALRLKPDRDGKSETEELPLQVREGGATVKYPVYLSSVMLPALGLSVMLAVNAFMNSALVSYVSSAIQYPAVSGSSLIISTFIGRIFFREKLKPQAYVAIVVGIAVIAVLNI